MDASTRWKIFSTASPDRGLAYVTFSPSPLDDKTMMVDLLSKRTDIAADLMDHMLPSEQMIRRPNIHNAIVQDETNQRKTFTLLCNSNDTAVIYHKIRT